MVTGPGGGPGHRGGPGVPRGERTVLSRHNFRRTYHAALAKLADPSGDLRPTAARTLKALRAGGPQTTDELAAQLAERGRSTKPATVQAALRELVAAGLVAASDDPAGPWSPLPVPPDPMLDGLNLHGAHDLRHTFSTWLEDAGIPARVINELMGQEATSRARQHQGSAIGARYRHTTVETAGRVIEAIEQRLAIVSRWPSKPWKPARIGQDSRCSDALVEPNRLTHRARLSH